MAAKAKNAEAEAKDEAEEAEGEGAQPKRKLPLKLIVIVAAGFVVLAGGGVGAYALFHHKAEEKPASAAVKPVAFFDLPDVVVNLSNAAGERAQYLKLKIVLELPDQTMGAQIQPVMPRVMDAFQTYLRELRPADLDGSGGLYRMRDELTRRINSMIAPHRINAVLFKEVVVQ
ncbi:MAG TPA: flagellar basal body-associated protein FliL [Xanthobacteraceae bacterium]|nr:flagellar basal body-associated protein FliL [Xanthobacteraceae bacterium]